MKTYDERRESVLQYMQQIKHRRRTVITALTGTALAVAVVLLVLLLPGSLPPAQPPQSLLPPAQSGITYDDLYQKLAEAIPTWEAENSRPVPVAPIAPGGPVEGGDGSGPQYVEVTDNQVSGVIEPDLFKRTDEYIFSLGLNTLSVYSIGGADTECINRYSINIEEDLNIKYEPKEIFLSEDGKTVTVLGYGVQKDMFSNEPGCIWLINLDVSDPTNISQSAQIFFTRYRYQSYTARMIDGDILFTYCTSMPFENIDANDRSTYVPQYGEIDSRQSIPAENIYYTDCVNKLRYGVVCRLDGKTLELKDSAALLSHTDAMYISEDTIYLPNEYTVCTQTAEGNLTEKTYTQISGVSYADGEFRYLGSVTIEGSIRNQYSMDQYHGILRMVSTTSERDYKYVSVSPEDAEYLRYPNGYLISQPADLNANLYCVDLSDWSIRVSVISFAPEGEEVLSARFDGDYAYVCTGVEIEHTYTDPVYQFDLRDLDNVTWKDTGIMEGYSHSLIDFGNGLLMGIGPKDFRTLKIDLYRETDTALEVVDSFEMRCAFPSDYKAYLIDRENGLIGFPLITDPDELIFGTKPFEPYVDIFSRPLDWIVETFGRFPYYYMLMKVVYDADSQEAHLEVAEVVWFGEFDSDLVRAVIVDQYLYLVDRGVMSFKIPSDSIVWQPMPKE